MENSNKNCSYKEHKEINAISYCVICNVYMCNKCENFHSNLCQDHQVIKLDKDFSEIFTGYCKEKDHQDKLNYYCKDHNMLCCAACISKIKNKSDGKHKDCEVFIIEDIKQEKLSKLKENIKHLENLSEALKGSINNLKNLFENIIKDKEEIKLKIQKVFTKLRNKLNEREEILLLEVDKIFDETYISEEMIRKGEKLPKQIQMTLENSKEIDNKYNNDNQINLLINDCITIENNIKDINKINESIKKYNNNNKEKILFYPENEDQIYNFIYNIQTFGQILKDEIFKSLILENNYEKKLFILDGIKDTIKKDKINFSLIFRMSEMGTKGEDFHKYCDNQGPTLVIIKTKTKRTFGGFTHLSWKKKSDSIKDKCNHTFIFSLDNMKIINLLDSDYIQITTKEKYGPIFGNWDFGFQENLKLGKSYANLKTSFLTNDNLILTGGKGNLEDFETEEIEIYKVIY